MPSHLTGCGINTLESFQILLKTASISKFFTHFKSVPNISKVFLSLHKEDFQSISKSFVKFLKSFETSNQGFLDYYQR